MSQAPELPDPLVGAVVAGRYHVVRRVAAGGMGVVYEARQEPLGRRVALKVIRGDVNDPVTRMRFEREARAASALQDAHVVVVHDFGIIEGGVAAGGLFLAMEYVEGTTLRAKLTAAGRLPWERSRPLIRQVAQALAAAHARQLVHRDLKPENIMLVDGGTGAGPVCKVLDFGLAKGTGHDALLRLNGEQLTHSGGFVGTPGYISPEVIDGATEDPRQDVYALGIVWWELLTGRHPFPAETPMKTLVRQMHEDAPVVDPMLRSTDNIPPGGADLLRDLMARDPQHRPKDGAAVLARLDALEHDTVIDRASPTAATTTTTPTTPTTAPTTPSASAPLPRWPDRQEAPTIDGRLHRQPALETQTSLTPPPMSSVAIAPAPSLAVPVLRRPRRRTRWLLAIGGAGAIGAGAMLLFERTVDTVTHPPHGDVVVDAGAGGTFDVVDAGVTSTELVINGVQTFAVFKQLRQHLPPHTLRIYRPGQGEVTFIGDIAAAVADAVQDLQIEYEGQRYAVEVGDMVGGRVVVTLAATVAPLVLPDAGVDVAPGGLEP